MDRKQVLLRLDIAEQSTNTIHAETEPSIAQYASHTSDEEEGLTSLGKDIRRSTERTMSAKMDSE